MKEKFYKDLGSGVRNAFDEVCASAEKVKPTGILDAAFEMRDQAHDLNAIIETLQAVNMDRLAKRLAVIQGSVLRCSARIIEAVPEWQQRELRQNEATAFGLLGVAMRMSDVVAERDAAKAQLNELQGGKGEAAETN